MQLIVLLSIPYAGVGQCPEKVQVQEKKVGCCKKKKQDVSLSSFILYNGWFYPINLFIVIDDCALISMNIQAPISIPLYPIDIHLWISNIPLYIPLSPIISHGNSHVIHRKKYIYSRKTWISSGRLIIRISSDQALPPSSAMNSVPSSHLGACGLPWKTQGQEETWEELPFIGESWVMS